MSTRPSERSFVWQMAACGAFILVASVLIAGWFHRQWARARQEAAAARALAAHGAEVFLDEMSLVSRVTGTPWRPPLVMFHDAAVTDSQLVSLEMLPNVASVQVDSNLVTDEGMKTLGRLTNLDSLIVREAAITDTGVSHLRGLERLTYLNLERCADITDTGMAYIATLPNLRLLDIRGCTGLTERGVARLRRALPNATIVWREEEAPGLRGLTKAMKETAHTEDADGELNGQPGTDL